MTEGMEYNGTIILNWECLPERRGHGDRRRFAPSPSGRLHLGNLLCALLVWLSARQKDGRVLLRVEDLDTARCPRRYSEQMERDLQWLGLDWDIGPGRDNGTGPYYQSQRTEIYQAALETLREKGLVYPCFCTRAELHAASAPHREDGQVVYAGTCRRLTAAEIAEKSRNRAPALRLITREERWGFTDGHMGRYEENLGGRLRRFSAAAVRWDVRLPVGCGGG